MVDTSRIHALISRARLRLRLQSSLEWATTALIVASAAALAVVYFVRSGALSESSGISLLVGCLGIVAAGAIAGAIRTLPVHIVATKIDRASNLADRLSTAISFEKRLKAQRVADEPAETVSMMNAAVKDAAAHSKNANVAAATPFRVPADTRAAAAFALVAAAVAFLVLPQTEQRPHIVGVDPTMATRGKLINLDGKRFCNGSCDYGTPQLHAMATDIAPTNRMGKFDIEEESKVLEADEVAESEARSAGPTYELAELPSELSVHFGRADEAIAAPVVSWTDDFIQVLVPADAPIGTTVITVLRGEERSRPIPFEVLADDDTRRLAPDAVVFADDDMEYTRDLLEDLKSTAKADQDQNLQEFVDKIEELLTKAEMGELSKEDLLEELQKAEEKFMEGAEENIKETIADLKEMGKELQKNKHTKELGKALEKNDLEKAQQEMEELAQKLENEELSQKEREKIAKAIKNAADKLDKADKKREEKKEREIERQKKKIAKLKKDREEEKDKDKKEQLTKKLEKEKRELKKLQRDKEKAEKSAHKRRLKKLSRNLKKSAENMTKKDKNDQKKAAKNMRDAKEDTGGVSDDQRKIKGQKKVASQVQDLKEALRRAKKKGQKGPKDLFGKNKKNDDFNKRSRGGKGSRGAWKPGQGKGKGKGKGQKPGGNGTKGQPSDSYGDGHDPDLMGDETAKSGDTKDESVSGTQGKGPSKRETILSAAQKGFSSQSYKRVYATYKNIVEEVMRTEKVPSGYKYYVKKYFQKIKPHSMD